MCSKQFVRILELWNVADRAVSGRPQDTLCERNVLNVITGPSMRVGCARALAERVVSIDGCGSMV